MNKCEERAVHVKSSCDKISSPNLQPFTDLAWVPFYVTSYINSLLPYEHTPHSGTKDISPRPSLLQHKSLATSLVPCYSSSTPLPPTFSIKGSVPLKITFRSDHTVTYPTFTRSTDVGTYATLFQNSQN